EMVAAGYRIADRLAARFDTARYAEPAGRLGDVGVELDRLEDRLVDRVDDGHEHLEDGCSGLGFLARHDLEHGFALLGARPFIDDRLDCAMTFMDRPGPSRGRCPAQAVELHFSEISLIDPHRDCRPAIAV